MTARKEFATPEAKAMLAAFDSDSPRDNRLEEYYPPDQSECVYCTTEEREDFERDREIALAADVIEDQRDYDDLVRWLVENCQLEEI